MIGHARNAPSSAHRFFECPGSIPLSEGMPDTESPYAAEGTCAHKLAEKCLSGGTNAADWKGFTIDTKARFGNDPWFRPGHANGKANGATIFEVTDEMIDGVQGFIDLCVGIAADSDDYEVEQHLNLDSLVEDSGGTGDFIAYSSAKQRVTIVDLKYGKGVVVSVRNNKQLRTYALGVALRSHNRGVKEIELIIFQPRKPGFVGPDREVIQIDALYEHAIALQDATERVKYARAEMADGLDNLSPGILVPGSWCKFCKAAPICPAIKQHVFELAGARIDVFGELTMDDPTKYNANKLASALTALPIVLTWYKSVEQFGHAEALRGRMPAGHKLVAKRATRKWKNEAEAAMTLQIAGLDHDDIFVTKMLSPAQIEMSLPKPERGPIIAELARKQSSGTVLALSDDPRPSVDPNDARGFEPVQIVEREDE